MFAPYAEPCRGIEEQIPPDACYIEEPILYPARVVGCEHTPLPGRVAGFPPYILCQAKAYSVPT